MHRANGPTSGDGFQRQRPCVAGSSSQALANHSYWPCGANAHSEGSSATMTTSQSPTHTAYMRWAKVHARVRYELTDSGMPVPDAHDIGADQPDIDLEVKGPYGDPALIQALGTRYRVDPEGVVLVPGASSANFIAMSAVLNHGDEVLIEHPIYDPIQRVAAFLGLRVSYIRREPGRDFGIQLDDVSRGLARGVRAVVFTNLHNPSGQFTSVECMTKIAECCRESDATLIVDEAYLDAHALTRGAALWTAAETGPNVIVTGSLTKVYGLSGLRTGWILTNPALAERARQIMDLLSVNNAAPAAALARRAMAHMDHLEDRYREVHRRGQRVFRGWLSEQSLMAGYPNHGAIFECLRLPDGLSSVRANELLVADYDVQIVPGRFFELDDHIRLSLTCPVAELVEALSRIQEAVERLVNRQ